jgi:hypothetical protein
MPLSRVPSSFTGTTSITSSSANTISIRTSSADRVIVDSNGIVGFGSTAPNITWPFRTVARPTSLGASPIAAWDGTTTPGISFNDNYPGVNFNGMYKYFPSGGTYYMGNGSLATIYLDPTSNSSDVLFSTANTGTANTISIPIERVRFNQFGVGLGQSQPTSGMGIRFPASQSASTDPNTLDDYEEGTWTPALSSTGASWSYVAQSGSYIKIGQFVYAQFYIYGTASGTTSNAVTMSGLPFTSTAINNPYEQGFGNCWQSGGTAIAFTINPGATTVTIWRQNAGVVGAIASQISASYLVGTLIYRASA